MSELSDRDSLSPLGSLHSDAAEIRRLRAMVAQLGEAWAILYDQSLNGVACDPSQACDSCAKGYELGREILDRLDPKWGNFMRSGSKFQPAFDEGEETR